MGISLAASMKDVASAAGVSIKTVSNVVHEYPFVTPKTRRRVEAAIKELGYRPNLSARSLRTGRSGLIALAVPELRIPYFAELADEIVRHAATREWTVLVEQTNGQRERELDVLIGHRIQRVDGVILSPLAITAADLRRTNPASPVVLLGERIYRGPLDHVSVDNVRASSAAVTHLLSSGRSRVAAIGAQRIRDAGTAKRRLEGYKAALSEAGQPFRPSLVSYVDDFSRRAGAQAMTALLDSRIAVDGVFAFSDLLAIGALSVLFEREIRVPEDIAVIGFDDIDEAAYCTPSLSSVSPDRNSLAEAALDLLRARVEGSEANAHEITVSHTVIQRRSTATRTR